MTTIRGVEFEDPVLEKERIAKVADTQSFTEKWLLEHTNISLRSFRIALGTIATLCFIAAVVFWILTYYTTTPVIQ